MFNWSDQLIQLARQFQERIAKLEDEKYDLEYQVNKKDYEITEMASKVNDMRGKLWVFFCLTYIYILWSESIHLDLLTNFLSHPASGHHWRRYLNMRPRSNVCYWMQGKKLDSLSPSNPSRKNKWPKPKNPKKQHRNGLGSNASRSSNNHEACSERRLFNYKFE